MLKIVRVKDNAGTEHAVFVGDTRTGYAARDLLSMTGAYDECVAAEDSGAMVLRKIDGNIGNYRTSCYGLCVVDSTLPVIDLTSDVTRVIALPATAANTVMSTMSSDLRENVRQAFESLNYYEGVTAASKVCLPPAALTELDAETANQMLSARQSYVLRATENQEIFQKDPYSEFGIRLPSLGDIHSELGYKYSPLDIIRSTMPYRRPGNPSSYDTLYHTPYYKVGAFMGMVPPHLQWIDGYSSNDLLDIQPNERHMQRNLYTLYQSDVCRYVREMITGIFLNTEFGSKISRLWRLREKEDIDRLVGEIKSYCGVDGAPGVRCELTTTDVEALWANEWIPAEVCRKLKESLVFDEGYFENMVAGLHTARKIVTTKNLIFVLDLDDDQQNKFSAIFIDNGFLTLEFHDFLLRLCQAAYEANWGHTGTAYAIPILVDPYDTSGSSSIFTEYLVQRESGKAVPRKEMPAMYRGCYLPSDSDEVDPDAIDTFSDDFDFSLDYNDESDEGVSISFNRYITKATAARLASGEVDMQALFNNNDGESEEDRINRLNRTLDSESKKVQRWMIVDGNRNLVYFLTNAFMQTADVKVYIQAFIKLVRWGDRRPKVLALQDHQEIRKVFDLALGVEADNTAIVDENDLVQVNGCDYSLTGFLSSTSNSEINPSHIIGFLLEKNYGTVVKQYLASWDDLAEMAISGNINIGEFKVGAAIAASPTHFIPIESFEKKQHEIYESDKNVSDGLTLKVRGRELSSIILLTRPQIMSDRAYIRSSMNNAIITLQDRQYDNLRRYTSNVRRFYSACGDSLSKMKNTMELQALAAQFAEFVKSGEGTKSEHNANMAANAMSRMSLNLGGSDIQYRNDELKGKFILVIDSKKQSVLDDTWEPIPFTHPKLQGIAAKVDKYIVLLLHKVSDGWVACRKDIVPEEVDVIRVDGNPKINSQHYVLLRNQLLALLKGGTATFEGEPLYLHETARLNR